MHIFDTEFFKEEQKEQKIISETGARIKLLIKQSGISQRELSHAVDIPPNVISYYCGGKRQPGVKDLVNLADYFHTSVDYLLGRTDMKTPPDELETAVKEIGFSEEGIKYLQNLDCEAKSTLEQMFYATDINDSEGDYNSSLFFKLLKMVKNYFMLDKIIKEKSEDIHYIHSTDELDTLIELINGDYPELQCFLDFKIPQMKKIIEFYLLYIERTFSDIIKLTAEDNSKL